MPIDFSFRKRAARALTNEVGVYVLCDLDQIPMYVGRSLDGIRSRVNRHLTSARSDIIANRQIDVWEIAWVWAYPCKKAATKDLEARLYHHCNSKNALMNGSIPKKPAGKLAIPKPAQIVQVMSDAEIKEKKDPTLRLPRQAERYAEIVNHFVAVKNSEQVARAMNAHFARLTKYHAMLVGAATEDEDAEE